jgi:hypothetical protein
VLVEPGDTLHPTVDARSIDHECGAALVVSRLEGGADEHRAEDEREH